MDFGVDEYLLKHLIDFVDEFNITDEFILSKVDNHITIFLEYYVENDLEIDYGSHIQQHCSPDGDIETDINMSSLESDIKSSLQYNLSDFNKSVLDLIEFDVNKVISGIDLNRKVEEFLTCYDPDENEDISSNYKKSEPYHDNIDSIFER
jgi:hypothetical protein